jgi:hypothetical protein
VSVLANSDLERLSYVGTACQRHRPCQRGGFCLLEFVRQLVRVSSR